MYFSAKQRKSEVIMTPSSKPKNLTNAQETEKYNTTPCSASKKPTRKSQWCPVFGYPSRAKETQLPTKLDTMRTFLQIRQEMKVTDSAPDPAALTVAERTAQHIEHIWIKASTTYRAYSDQSYSFRESCGTCHVCHDCVCTAMVPH
nr:uncharacterized protein LOC124815108 [Hydra vulgaris]